MTSSTQLSNLSKWKKKWKWVLIWLERNEEVSLMKRSYLELVSFFPKVFILWVPSWCAAFRHRYHHHREADFVVSLPVNTCLSNERYEKLLYVTYAVPLRASHVRCRGQRLKSWYQLLWKNQFGAKAMLTMLSDGLLGREMEENRFFYVIHRSTLSLLRQRFIFERSSVLVWMSALS